MTYLLREGLIIKCSMAEYLASLAEGERFVLRTAVGELIVQTCFTGLDMTMNDLKPQVFETCVVSREAIELPIRSLPQMAEKVARMQGAYVGAVVFSSTYPDAMTTHHNLLVSLAALQQAS